MTIVEGLRQEGFQKGIRTNVLNIARTMLDVGVSLEDVPRSISLTVENLVEINHQ